MAAAGGTVYVANLVARSITGSGIMDHISSSIGRKLHDEQNSCRLARRWRRDYVAAADVALRAWCRDYFDHALIEPRDHDRVLMGHAWLYAHRLSRTPPMEAIVDLETALDREFARWAQVMAHYYAAVRKELKALRGKEVVTTGDGLLATFWEPAAGVQWSPVVERAQAAPVPQVTIL